MYEKWINELIKVELFNNIEKQELSTILNCIKPAIKTYKKKEIIAFEKDEMIGIGVVLEGEILISKENQDGDRMILAQAKKGQLFGEIAAFSIKKWPATIFANTNCTVLFFPTEKIVGLCNKMCDGHKVLIMNMLQIVSKKALMLNKKVEILSLKSIRKKLSTYLLDQRNTTQSDNFQIPLNRNELAEYLLVTRPSLSRELANMKSEGIIEFNKNKFEILDLSRLKECL